MGRIVVAGWLLITLVASARAGLAPSKASQLVNLVSGAACTCAGASGTLIDTIVKPDGTTAPFAIPAKRVLVLDAWSWQSLAGPAGDTLFFCLGASASYVSWTSAAPSLGGVAFHDSTLPLIAVTSGVPICVASYVAVPVSVHMHGFLAADK
jgi:hypothetical protein